VTPSPSQEIDTLVSTATAKYDFRRQHQGHTLFRVSDNGVIECLVNGLWIRARRPRRFDDTKYFLRISNSGLHSHVERYFLNALDEPAISWKSHFVDRLRRSTLWRWVMPPSRGGGNFRRESIPAISRTRRALNEALEKAENKDLAELKDEAIRGVEFQQDRSAGVEQRASFLLAAAGLSSSLVLANAGLLIGTVKLHDPWLQLAAASLAVASVCAAVTGLRSIQATMFNSAHVVPHHLGNRRTMSGDELIRSYVAQLQLAEFRARAVSEWKAACLASARRWFLGALAGIVLLTMFVLVEAVQQPSAQTTKVKAEPEAGKGERAQGR
jgi:hypothetical protein